MRVLITGRNGFLARELSERLDDFKVTCVGRQEVDLTNSHNVDLFFEDKTFDAVLHTAIIGGRRGQQDEFKDFLDSKKSVVLQQAKKSLIYLNTIG